MIKPTATPTTAAELNANIAQSRAIEARYIRDLRYDLRTARAMIATAPSASLRISYQGAADSLAEELAAARRDAANAHPRLRTAAAACARADLFEAAAGIFNAHGQHDYRGSRTPAKAARHLALAKSLRAHARTLPIG